MYMERKLHRATKKHTYIFLVANGHLDIDRFLVSGHGFWFSDRNFTLIENQAKRSRLSTVNDVKTIIIASSYSIIVITFLEEPGILYKYCTRKISAI